jgi:succinyl-CoA synthetase alpha subunit
VPIFDTVKEAIESTGANTSIVIVPAPAAPDAIMEAAAAGIDLIVAVTEHIPVLDMIRVRSFLGQTKTRLIGPNCAGVITPGQAKVGIMPGHIYLPGSVGIVSRSGTLSYEIVQALSTLGIGQSTAVGIGGDPIAGATFIEILRLFEADPLTKHVVIIGEIGGTDEQKAAAFIGSRMSKPVTAFIAGQTAPFGRRMGHAGAIIQGEEDTAQQKIAAFKAAGVRVATLLEEVAVFVNESLG